MDKPGKRLTHLANLLICGSPLSGLPVFVFGLIFGTDLEFFVDVALVVMPFCFVLGIVLRMAIMKMTSCANESKKGTWISSTGLENQQSRHP